MKRVTVYAAAPAAPPATALVDALLPPRAAARLLGLSVASLARWRCLGTGPAYLLLSRRAVRYRVSSLERFMGDRELSSTAARPEMNRTA